MQVLVVLSVILSGVTACDKSTVSISGVSGDSSSYYDRIYGNYLDSYVDLIHIFCSSVEAKNLAIDKDGVKQPVESLNATTVKLTLQNLAAPKGIFKCTDIKTNCEESLLVHKFPVVTVIAPNVLQRRFYHKLHFFVPYGEEYEVLCTCTDCSPKELRLLKKDKVIQTEIINSTTIKSTKQNETDANYSYDYDCEGLIPETIAVVVDHPPKATDFLCVAEVSIVRCNWNSLSLSNTYTLYTLNEDGSREIICANRMVSSICLLDLWKSSMNSDNTHVHDKISLVLHVCNDFFCANESFIFNYNSIVRGRPPFDLEILQTTSYGAVVGWISEVRNYRYEYLTLEYRVTLNMYGVESKELDLSAHDLNCTEQSEKYERCQLVLDLPCPGKLYIIDVYSKVRNTPSSNVYWSEPAGISFHTDSQDTTENIDPRCSAESELIVNKDGGIYAVKTFTRMFRKDLEVVNEKVNYLKQKLAKLERLRA